VRWLDTDASGRIHYSGVFRWVEIAETELFRKLDLMDGRERYPKRALKAEYLQPVAFDDVIDLELTVDRVGRSSLTMSWEARRAGQLVARGVYTSVYVDESGRPHPLPDVVRARACAASSG
jgi:acyl-CoA thioester hydrolase